RLRQQRPAGREGDQDHPAHGRAAADAGRGAQETWPADAQLAAAPGPQQGQTRMPTPGSSPIKTVGIVGGGVIGSGWAARSLAHGLDVVATDPAPGAEKAMRDSVANAWPALTRVGLKPGASVDRLTFVKTVGDLGPKVDFIQESAPER